MHRLELAADLRSALLDPSAMPEHVKVDGATYRLTKPLDAGFKGAVWKVADRYGSPRAIKFAIVEDYENRSLLEEMSRARRLEPHPVFAALFAAEVTSVSVAGHGSQEFACFVEEYVPGVSLRALLRDAPNRVTVSFIDAYVADMAQALSALAVSGLRHDDLHDGNVLIADPPSGALDPGARVRVIDLGSLKPASAPLTKDTDDHGRVVRHPCRTSQCDARPKSADGRRAPVPARTRDALPLDARRRPYRETPEPRADPRRVPAGGQPLRSSRARQVSPAPEALRVHQRRAHGRRQAAAIYAGGAESAKYRAYGVGASVTLTQLSRLAEALAVTPADLLSMEGAGPVGPPANDVAVLLAALMDDAKDSVNHIDDVADALGWSLERIEEAARDASERLPALGLTLHRNHGGGLCVRAGHAVLSPEERQRLARAKTVRTKLHLHQARVLRHVARGDLAKNWRRKLSADRRLSIQALLKRGLVEDTPQGLRLTATAAYSLMLTDDTAAGEEASQALDVDWSTTDLQKSRKRPASKS